MGYLYSPQGQKAIHEGATAIKEGVIIAGKTTTKAAKAAVEAILRQEIWITYKAIEGAVWVRNKVREELLNLKEKYNLKFSIEIVIKVEKGEVPAMYLDKKLIEFAYFIDATYDFDMYIY